MTSNVEKATLRIKGNVVKALAASRGWTMLDLASQAGLGEATVYRMVSGAAFTSETLEKLANALQCNPLDLLEVGMFPPPLVGASPVASVAA